MFMGVLARRVFEVINCVVDCPHNSSAVAHKSICRGLQTLHSRTANSQVPVR
jgi:hypothetical protein